VPRAMRTVDSILMQPEKLFQESDFDARQTALNRQRAEFIETFPDLHPEVKAVFQAREAAMAK
jgi:hypothetical protein